MKAIARFIRRHFPSLYQFLIWALYNWKFKQDVRAYGLIAALRVAWDMFRIYVLKHRFTELKQIKIAGFPDTLYYRPGTSDLQAIKQMLFQKFYEPIAPSEAPAFILDCGGNVGASAIYFLWKYPHAHITVVEPDPSNFTVCAKNLDWYIRKGQATCLRSAIWSRPAGLKLVRGELGREWEVEVRECVDGEVPDLEAIDIGTILARSGYDAIDILKIDIEGAERRILIPGAQYQNWLDRTHHLAIELHGDDCTRIFLEAMSAYDYEPSERGDVTICSNIRRKPAAGSPSASRSIVLGST